MAVPSGTLVATANYHDAWEMVVIQDSQMLTLNTPGAPVFYEMTNWIASNAASRDIKMVVHMGDVTSINSGSGLVADHEQQLTDASGALAVLDDAGIPWMPNIGNHDYDSAYPYNYTHWTTYFPVSRFSGKAWYGGRNTASSYNDNLFFLFSAGGKDYVLVGQSYNQTTAAQFAWAASVFDAYPSRVGLYSTHSYLWDDGGYTGNNTGHGNWTYNITNDVITVCPNVLLTMNGHDSAGDGQLNTTQTVGGRTVWNMLYGHANNVTLGYLRILRFVPAEGKIYATTYSPHTDTWLTDAPNQWSWDVGIGTI